MNHKSPDTAIFGGGCFWCTEAVFQRLKGISKVISGYAGGYTENPTYGDVSDGLTGHAEVIQIEFDPKEITYNELLDIFFHVHDPTTLNKQGADAGTQYRSIILYTSEEQKQQAEEMLKKLKESKEFDSPIVTEIKPLQKFYTAEEYHQNYYNTNQNQPYCQIVITPKVNKFLQKYADKLKDKA